MEGGEEWAAPEPRLRRGRRRGRKERACQPRSAHTPSSRRTLFALRPDITPTPVLGSNESKPSQH